MTRARLPRPLFRLLGFPVYVPLSAWLGIALVAAINSDAFAAYGGTLPTIAYAVGLYLTVLVHELAHAMAARRTGHEVLAITLGILGGATIYDEERNPNPKHEFGTALVGPLASIALGVVLDGAAGTPEGAVSAVIAALGFINIALGIMNLLPAAPLDGGHVLEAFVWRITGSRRTGMRVTAGVGWLLGALLFITGWWNGGVPLLVFLGALFTFEAGMLWQRSRIVG